MFGGLEGHLPDVYENGFYRRALSVDAKLALVSLSSNGTIMKPKLKVEVHSCLSVSNLRSLRRVLYTMVEASYDYEHFRRVAKRDPLMSRLSAELAGIRPIRPPTIFEALVIAITEQQISLNAAITIRSRLVQRYGARVDVSRGSFYAFPTPETLANRDSNELRKAGLSRNKARYINELSKSVATGELKLDTVRSMPDDEAAAELMKIDGVGRWSAEYVLLRGLGRVNSLPADDLGVQRAVSQCYFHGRQISSDKVRQALAKFAPYSGIAAFYLMYHSFWTRDPSATMLTATKLQQALQVA